MKVGKYDIDIDFSTVETFDGENPAPKGFWYDNVLTHKEDNPYWLSCRIIFFRTIMFGFKKWGIWVYITKYK